MEHTTKMVMIPQNVYSGLITKEQQTYSPLIGQLANLDQEMQTIMSNPNLSTDEKYQLYQQTFSRYQHLKNQQFPRENHPIKITSKPQPVNIEENTLLAGLPKNVRTKGKLLIQHLKRHNQSIEWLPNGQLKNIKGTPIPDSNLVDLVHYVTRNRPTARPPPGVADFLELLHDTNVPKEAISVLEDTFFTPKAVVGTSYSPIDRTTPKQIQKELKEDSKKKRLEKIKSTTPKRPRKKPNKYGNWEEQ